MTRDKCTMKRQKCLLDFCGLEDVQCSSKRVRYDSSTSISTSIGAASSTDPDHQSDADLSASDIDGDVSPNDYVPDTINVQYSEASIIFASFY